MLRSAWGGWVFFNTTTVSKDPQCSERIIVSQGFNINDASPRTLHISWSSHPKELSFCVNRNKYQLHEHKALDLVWKWSSASLISPLSFHSGNVQTAQKDVMHSRFWIENYIMFNCSPMGLAAGKTEISVRLMNYMKWDLAAIIVTIQDWWGCQEWIWDNNISVILFGNNWIQSNLILILRVQTEALTEFHYVNQEPSRQRLYTHASSWPNHQEVTQLWFLLSEQDRRKRLQLNKCFWPVATLRSKKRTMACISANAKQW